MKDSNKRSTDFEQDIDIVWRTKSAYSKLADDYIGHTGGFARYPGLDHELREFSESLGPGPVLDVGCGSGRDALFISSLGRAVVAVDLSYEMIHHLTDSEINGHLVCGNILSLPFRDNSFEGAIASGVLLHLPRSLCIRALREIRRVLDVEGRAIISMKRGTGESWRTTLDFPLPRWFSYYGVDEFSNICIKADLWPTKVWVSARKDWFTVMAAKRQDA